MKRSLSCELNIKIVFLRSWKALVKKEGSGNRFLSNSGTEGLP